jgi:histidinol-phosphatase
MGEDLGSYLDFAVESAYLAGRLTLGYFQTGLRPEVKSDSSPVTVADRESEKLIRRRIEARFPRHAIIGEEFGAHDDPAATHRWFVDPIDGTKSFLRGVPLYAVLIGLEIEGQVQVGVAYFPALDDMVAAASGLGCWWNGRRAQVSEVARLKEAVVTFTDPLNFDRVNQTDAWERVKTRTYYRAGWGDAYGISLVATGRSDLHLEALMNPWDSAPFPPILHEAGGYFGDWQGNVSIYDFPVLATTQALLPQVLELLQGPGV